MSCMSVIVCIRLFILWLDVFMYDCILPVLTIVLVDDESVMVYNLLICFAKVLTSLAVATPNNELAISPTKGRSARLERERDGAGGFYSA